MDPAWIAVLGGAVGAGGATVAAGVSAWATRRQAVIQGDGQRLQWQRERRREGYAALLDAGSQARDELAAARRALAGPEPDLVAASRALDAAGPLVKATRRASAAIFVDGPESILEPTRRAEEHVTILHELLISVANGLAAGRAVDEDLALCRRQEACVRDLMDGFAAAAREVSTGSAQTPRLLPTAPAVRAEAETAWLLDYLSAELGWDRTAIDPDRPVGEAGLDSVGVLRLTQAASRHFGLDRAHVWPVSSLMFGISINEFAGYLARMRP